MEKSGWIPEKSKIMNSNSFQPSTTWASGLQIKPFSMPEDLPDPGIEPVFLASPALAGGFFFFFFWQVDSLPLTLLRRPKFGLILSISHSIIKLEVIGKRKQVLKCKENSS